MNIYIIRHGQTDWNIEKKLQGTEDIPLNDTGRAQAVECANALQAITWDAIYTSPLSRALETGKIISSHTNLAPVIVEPLLVERDFGEASGLTYEQMHLLYPDYPDVLPEGMEGFDSLCRRMINGVERCISSSAANNILLISHGGSINALLHTLSEGAFGTGVTFLKNACISLLAYQEDTRELSVLAYNLTPEEYLLLFSHANF